MMSKNERRMITELAKSMVRLGDMIVIMQKHIQDEQVVTELTNLLQANQEGTNVFLDLAAKEWFPNE